MTEPRKKEQLLRASAEVLRTEPDSLPAIIQKFKREIEETEKEIAKLRKEMNA